MYQHGPCPLGRKASVPVLRTNSPANLDAWRKVRVEIRHGESDEADEEALAPQFRSERPETVFSEVVLDAIKSVLQQGQLVKIAGFGNFIVRKKRARKGRNPKTGQEIGITPRKVVTFRPSQVFKKYVNSVQSV